MPLDHSVNLCMLSNRSLYFISGLGWGALAPFLKREMAISLCPIGFGAVVEHAGYFQAWLSLAVCCLAAVMLCYLLPGTKQSGKLERILHQDFVAAFFPRSRASMLTGISFFLPANFS